MDFMVFTRAAVVHVGRTHPEGAPMWRPKLDGEWPLREQSSATRRAFCDGLELLLPVAYRQVGGVEVLTVLEARWIVGYRLTAQGKVVFDTVPAPAYAYLVGGPSPVIWTEGQAWPVKVVDLPATGGQLPAAGGQLPAAA
ncbi:hypothetical protein GB931_09395 [Modestobacter sp. I12A-02628]|uniref:Uncharacterized protein n=1 Tax=Goekera deserti TaxID=2497753 RepID=A0A7K3WJM1_9ACTN|nr:hypothetical protein [Goekera deserti]MPQ98131.1 hypothetical protein [Goekera deserti]NDI48779.1 hypothetical protein [Goekera deserti]NEL56698.1 hypothetical protein [Goekera deserti]